MDSRTFAATLPHMSYLYTAAGNKPTPAQLSAFDTALDRLAMLDVTLTDNTATGTIDGHVNTTAAATAHLPLPVRLLLDPLVVRFQVLHGRKARDGQASAGEYERMGESVFKWYQGHTTVLARYMVGLNYCSSSFFWFKRLQSTDSDSDVYC